MSRFTALRPHWPFIVLLAVVALALFIRLDSVPAPWYDEGLNINAAQTFAETGQYALRSGHELRLADPAIQTGPPLIVPLGLLERWFGGSMALMRLPTVISGLVLLILLYSWVGRLYGSFAAFVAVLVLVLMPGESTANYVFLSRQVLGEIPALLFIVLGIRALTSPQKHLNALTALILGLCWGIAILLKSQVLLVLTVTVAFTGLYHLIRRSEDWTRWLLVGIVMVGLFALDTLWRTQMAGPMLDSNSATLREGILIHILPLRALQTLIEPGALIRIVFMVGSVAAMLFIRWRFLPHADHPGTRRAETFLWLFIVVWALWFGVFSIGWRRYAFIGQVMAAIPFAFVIGYLWTRLRLPANNVVYAGLLAVGLIVSIVVYAPKITDPASDQFYAALNFVNQELPSESRILSWEWAASYFSRQDFQFPHTTDVNAVTQQYFLGQSTEVRFDPLAGCPQYILLGSFDLDRVVFQEALDLAQPTPLFEQGIYAVYAIPPERLQQDPTTGRCQGFETTPRKRLAQVQNE